MNNLVIVSVPIRGLFNLTLLLLHFVSTWYLNLFPSPLGDYLI